MTFLAPKSALTRLTASLLIVAASHLPAWGGNAPKLALNGQAAGDEGFYTLLDKGRPIIVVHVVCGSAGARLDFWDEAGGTPYRQDALRTIAGGFPLPPGAFIARGFCNCDEALPPEKVAARQLMGKLRRHHFPNAAPVDPF